MKVKAISLWEPWASLMAGLSRANRNFGNFDCGRFAWCTSNLRTFDPFPVRGWQGLFDVELPPDIRWVA